MRRPPEKPSASRVIEYISIRKNNKSIHMGFSAAVHAVETPEIKTGSYPFFSIG